MKIPTTLKHKPVIVVNDYDKIDGNYKDSDAKGLSIGLAQWNDRGRVDISAKVWSYTGEMWSRQSAELPLHRVLDLAILICKAKQYLGSSGESRVPCGKDNAQIGSVPLKNGDMEIAVCTDNEMIGDDIELLRDALMRDDELLGERLARLATILKDMGC